MCSLFSYAYSHNYVVILKENIFIMQSSVLETIRVMSYFFNDASTKNIDKAFSPLTTSTNRGSPESVTKK